jgi:hypothetical protein
VLGCSGVGVFRDGLFGPSSIVHGPRLSITIKRTRTIPEHLTTEHLLYPTHA